MIFYMRLARLAIGLPLFLIACTTGASETRTPPVVSPTVVPSSLASSAAGSSSSPTVASSASSVSVPAPARTITEADSGATVHITVSATIALSLRAPSGSDPWQVHQPDPLVLLPITFAGATVPPNVTQQAYRAVGVGQAAITAESRPHCDPGKACAQVIQGFRVTVIVTT